MFQSNQAETLLWRCFSSGRASSSPPMSSKTKGIVSTNGITHRPTFVRWGDVGRLIVSIGCVYIQSHKDLQ